MVIDDSSKASASDRIGSFLWEIDRIQALFAGAVAVLDIDGLPETNEDVWRGQSIVKQANDRLGELREHLDHLSGDLSRERLEGRNGN